MLEDFRLRGRSPGFQDSALAEIIQKSYGTCLRVGLSLLSCSEMGQEQSPDLNT